MTSVMGLEISIFQIPLDVAGSQLISQQTGYFHLWRFLNSDQSVSLDGEIRCTFGGQWNQERVPFGYNTKLALATPVDRVLLEWDAQPGRIAEILLTRDPRGLDGQNTPSKQLVYQGQASSFLSNKITIAANPSSTAILSPNTRRSRAIIAPSVGNPSAILIGQASQPLAEWFTLEPGASFVSFSSGELRASGLTANCKINILSEFF